MPPVNVLIKPASSACNMTCAYCFYRDVASHRQEGFQGMLSPRLMEEVVAGAMEFAEHSCSFLFQGGEPTLAGLDFYRQVVKLVKKHEKPGVKVSYAIQTNAFRLDEEWCAFFKEHDFLVGVSLDGPAELHNLNRTDPAQNGTFNDVMRSVALLKKHGVTFNILCVLTGKNARSIERIYRFFRKQGLDHIQFIPCLEPLGQERGRERYHLPVEEYGEFLIRVFDLWFQDLLSGQYVSIRHIDNWLQILLGASPRPAAWWAGAPSSSWWKGTAACTPATFTCWTSCGWARWGKTPSPRWPKAPPHGSFCSVRRRCRRSAPAAAGTCCAATAAAETG